MGKYFGGPAEYIFRTDDSFKSWYIFTKPRGVILERLFSLLLTMRTENLTKLLYKFKGLRIWDEAW